MLDQIRLATIEDYDAVWTFYSDVCAQMPHDRYTPGWTIGVFPAESDIRGAIEAGELRVGTIGGDVVAAMVLSPTDDEEHAGVPWPSGAAPEDASAIHLLAVHPSQRGRHVGSELVREAVRASREWGKRAVRLDVMPGNLAASRMYVREGFAFVCEHDVYYEDTGTIAYEMYELAL